MKRILFSVLLMILPVSLSAQYLTARTVNLGNERKQFWTGSAAAYDTVSGVNTDADTVLIPLVQQGLYPDLVLLAIEVKAVSAADTGLFIIQQGVNGVFETTNINTVGDTFYTKVSGGTRDTTVFRVYNPTLATGTNAKAATHYRMIIKETASAADADTFRYRVECALLYRRETK
jgi:hypothetical protein